MNEPQNCADELEDITALAQVKRSNAKIILSLATPRKDDFSHHTNGQIINALLKQKFHQQETSPQ
jgi:hypothetical protein